MINQLQKIRIILHDLIVEGMILNEPLQVAAIIEKLPPLWKNFKKCLKNKCKELKLEEFIVRLQIAEGNRNYEVKTYNTGIETDAKANLANPSTSHKIKRHYNDFKQWKA